MRNGVQSINKEWLLEPIAKVIKEGVTPAKAGGQKFLKKLDSSLRENDNLGLMQLPL
jgi:hypothetical protein